MTLLGRALLASCVLVLLSQPAAAQEQRTFLDVTVNSVSKGDTLVVLRGSDALVSAAWLTGAGLTGFTGRRETIDDADFVSLASLAPAATFVFDERELRLAIIASPDLLGTLVRDLQQGRPENLVYRHDTSGFVNYALSLGSTGESDLFSEAGISLRGALAYTTLTATGGSVVRGLSNITIDDRSRIRRWIFGDAFAATGTLGGDAQLAGVTVAREFAVEPYFVRYPTLSLSTPLSTPSSVEVYVNGRLVREEKVAPGRLDIRNLPLTTGQNNTRIVIRDPFGATRELTSGYYSTASVLAPGVHDYQYSVGLKREAQSTASFNYSTPTLLARHRVGISDSFTAGGRVEAAPGIVSGGPAISLRLPFGEVEAAAAASHASGLFGTAASASFSYAGRSGSVGASMRRSDAHYATLGLTAFDRRPRTEVNAFASMPLGHGLSLSAQHGYGVLQDATTRMRSELLASARLGSRTDFIATAARIDEGSGPHTEVTVGMTVMFGGRTSATATMMRGSDGTSRSSVDLQRPLPMGTGYGYQVRAGQDLHQLPSGAVQYQGAYGRYEVRQDMSSGRPHTNVNISGALVGIGGGLFATRPVRSSFALVQVPGIKDVRGFSANQAIGRTNAHGNILVPDLLPYYANQLNIADTDVPLDYVIPRVQATVAPPYRGGILVRFPVQRIQRSEGRVMLVTGGVESAPTFGELTVTTDGEHLASPLGRDGEFYFENLPPGHHPAVIQYDQGSCTFTLDVPVAADAVARLGVVRCTVAEKSK